MLSVDASAEPTNTGRRTFGAGLVAGDPTGLTLKFRFTPEQAIQSHIGWGFGAFDDGHAIFVFDYLFHFAGLFPGMNDSGLFAPYAGIGAKLGLRESSKRVNAGLRAPFGISFLLTKVPLEIFGELALGIHLAPDVTPLIDGGVGARWYF